MDNNGKNASGNLGSGEWPMPEPATMSQADVAIDMSGLIHAAATGAGASDGHKKLESPPPAGGNDGTL